MLLAATGTLLLLLLVYSEAAAAAVLCLYPAVVVRVLLSMASQKHPLGMQLHDHWRSCWLRCMLLLLAGCPGAAAAGPGARVEPSSARC
jgi:hypothetical protein